MPQIKSIQNPEWLNLYTNFKDIDYQNIITYKDLNRMLLSGDIKTDKRYVFERFKKEMLIQNNKYLENIPNKGYRIVHPNEHVRLTNREMKRAERRARQAANIILHTEMDKLTEREQAIARLAAARVQPILATIIGEQKSLLVEQKTFQLPKYPR